MKTKKMLALAAFASGLLLNAPSYASMIIIDDFSVKSVQPENAIKTISYNIFSPENFRNKAEDQVANNILDTSNSINQSNKFNISQLVPEGIITSTPSATFSFTAVLTDNQLTNSNLNLILLLNNTQTVSLNTPKNITNKTTSFALNSTQLQAVNGDGALALGINGASGGNLEIGMAGGTTDNQSTNVPEPALMGLVGISLTAFSLLHGKKRS